MNENGRISSNWKEFKVFAALKKLLFFSGLLVIDFYVNCYYAGFLAFIVGC